VGTPTTARDLSYPIPALGFRGVPTAIDIRRVVETGILPIVNALSATRYKRHTLAP
jgi:hypothetical protein